MAGFIELRYNLALLPATSKTTYTQKRQCAQSDQPLTF